MKYSTSKEKLSQLHEELDRELEQINVQPRISTGSRRDKEELRFNSNFDEPKRPPAYKPPTIDHNVRDVEIKTKKNEINELERKLMELENKMNNIQFQQQNSDDEQDERVKAHLPNRANLHFQEKGESHLNQDTARFLLSEANKQKEKAKYQYSYPSLQDDDEEEEDSEDYAEMQRVIQKRRQEAKEQNIKKTVNKLVGLGNKPSYQPKRDTDRKISTQTQSVLKPKYSNEKPIKNENKTEKSRVSQGKNSIRDSVTSKKSTQKVQQPLNRANSKRSINSNNSIRNSRAKNNFKQKNDRSFDRFSEKNEDILHNEQMDLAKDLKKMSNLEKEVVHYKRLVKKYKQQLEDYRIMEIEFKELKKNFAKSELIRTQQKKIIETLKHKIGSK